MQLIRALIVSLSFFALVGWTGNGVLASESAPVRDKNVEARLVSSHATIQPGKPFYLALELKIDPTWHTYWINPGDAGKATSLRLEVPEGFSVGELEFPLPKKFIVDYGHDIRLGGFGYEDEVVHTLVITPPADWQPGQEVVISGRAAWLMCDPETCIPGKADLSVTLHSGEESVASAHHDRLEAIRAALPVPEGWEVAREVADGFLVTTVSLPAGALPGDAKLNFFPADENTFDLLEDPVITVSEGKLKVKAKAHESLKAAPDEMRGLLVVESAAGRTGHLLGWGEGAGSQGESATGDADDDDVSDLYLVEDGGTDSAGELPFGGGLIGVLLAAFLGGIILNIMPCVFPVISLKVMSFVGQAGEDRKKVLAHAATFALGILVFFWILTMAMLAIRSASGGEVGWGAQLQYPGFVVGLIFVMVAVAMSLFGVFEIGTSMTTVGGGLASKSGYAGSFWSGALAVLLATPCTAPLMAPAIGFALAQSAPVMFLVFTSLGLGLAAPYFIFAVFPKLLDIIPAPGAWMETFKQFMGFPMLAVAVWLTGVLSKQLEVAGLQWALAAVLFLAFAGWILGRFTSFERPRPTRIKARVVALLVFLLALGTAWQATGKRAAPSEVDIAEVIAGHRAAGKNVFVDFTAEWCLTCKVNKRVAINVKEVQDAFAANNVEFVTADWTNEDPSITRVLAEYGRAGVPFYLLYPADSSLPPLRFGDGILTPGHILDAIDQLPK